VITEVEEYWENRYQEKDTGWDMGMVSPPLKTYFDQLKNKNLKILIPGAGNSYEAEYLYRKGFKNIYVVDIAKSPLNYFLNRNPDFPRAQLIHDNFFNIEGDFDLIIEQTFFCAINPIQRNQYALKAISLLKKKAKLVGVLFSFPLTEKGPPFGGSKEEYLEYFEPIFNIKTFEKCYNSHPKRQGKELFINMINKSKT